MNEEVLMSTELWWQTYLYLQLQIHDWSLSQKQTRHLLLLQSACSIFRLCNKFLFPVWGDLQLLAQSTDYQHVLSVLNGQSAQVTSPNSLLSVSLVIHQLEISQAIAGLPLRSFIYICVAHDILDMKTIKQVLYNKRRGPLSQMLLWLF